MPEGSSKTISRDSVQPPARTKSANSTPPLNSPGSSRPSSPLEPPTRSQQQQPTRRPSFGLNFLSNFGMRSHNASSEAPGASSSSSSQPLMSNSPTLGNIHQYANDDISGNNNNNNTTINAGSSITSPTGPLDDDDAGDNMIDEENMEEIIADGVEHQDDQQTPSPQEQVQAPQEQSNRPPQEATFVDEENKGGLDKDGLYSVRLTPLIDHSSSSSGLYFSPVIRRLPPKSTINIGRYTEKNKAAAHAPQGSSAPIVFKSKVVSRTHALFFCNEDGQWFLRDTKSSSGTFLNHIRLSPASQESSLMPVIDGDIIQLGMDYRGGTEEVYRLVKMRCHFNNSWQRKMNPYNIEMFKKLQIGDKQATECSICLNTIQPGHPMFISTCGHWWHYRCIHPLLQKSYPLFSCPNCRYVCDLEYFSESE
ncbi:MAG: FHA domain-containing protein [Asgard group archaeon]|nr:FHA domain-containing protein [Asgard group archaeon]